MKDKNRYLKSNALINIDDMMFEIAISPTTPKEMAELIEQGMETGDYDEGILRSVSKLINQVSSQIEGYIGRPLGHSTYSEVRTTSPTTAIDVDNYPITKLHSITNIGAGTGSYDVDAIMKLNNPSDLNAGRLFIEPLVGATPYNVGLGRYAQFKGRSLHLEYDAGYVLPKDATDDNPSTLPSDIEGVAMGVAKGIFLKSIDVVRSENLMQLMEGNISRMWASEITTKLNMYGDIERQYTKILDRYKASKGLMSV